MWLGTINDWFRCCSVVVIWSVACRARWCWRDVADTWPHPGTDHGLVICWGRRRATESTDSSPIGEIAWGVVTVGARRCRSRHKAICGSVHSSVRSKTLRPKTIIGLASAGALACVGTVGLFGSAAFGAPAVHPPVSELGIIYPSPDPTGALPPGGPGVTVVGTCPAFLLGGNAIGFLFQSGNATLYRIPPGSPPGTSNGGNVEGIADLVYAAPGIPPTQTTPGVPPSQTVFTDSGYQGHSHLWFGTNSNANGQSYFGETISFSGTAPDGSTISITANPGSNTSASGNMNGWGKLKVTCT